MVQARRAKAPRDAALAYEEGELLAHVGLDERALAAFDEAHALAPDDALPAVAAAALLLSKKKPDAAGAQARLAPFLDGPHASAEARFHQGLALEAAGDPSGARPAYERALELDPLHVPSMRNLALLAEQGGDDAGALVVWRRVKRSEPRDAASGGRREDRGAAGAGREDAGASGEREAGGEGMIDEGHDARARSSTG